MKNGRQLTARRRTVSRRLSGKNTIEIQIALRAGDRLVKFFFFFSVVWCRAAARDGCALFALVASSWVVAA